MRTADHGDEGGPGGSERRASVTRVYEAIEAAGGPEVPYHAHTTARIAAFLREVVSATAASRVLDAGCGGLEYLQGPHRWVGIDWSTPPSSPGPGPRWPATSTPFPLRTAASTT